jgi:hypothetical protein
MNKKILFEEHTLLNHWTSFGTFLIGHKLMYLDVDNICVHMEIS